LFFLFVGDLSELKKDDLKNEISQVRKKVMEEMKRIELGKNKEEIGKEMMKNVGMMKLILCYCVKIEWNYTSCEQQWKIFKELIIPVCESALGESEEGIVPSDARNGDGVLLDILYSRMGISECRRLLCCSEQKELFGRILRLSKDQVFNRTRQRVFLLLKALISRGEREQMEWMRKEGGIQCGCEGMKTNERMDKVEYQICFFLSDFYERELKGRRNENRLSERERKEMRAGMWEMEEQGGSDVVLPLLHHFYDDVRVQSGNLIEICGGPIRRETIWWV
jgi:hypothetical protein